MNKAKHVAKKLTLNTETVRVLEAAALEGVEGGNFLTITQSLFVCPSYTCAPSALCPGTVSGGVGCDANKK
jgi:hypothetical protein